MSSEPDEARGAPLWLGSGGAALHTHPGSERCLGARYHEARACSAEWLLVLRMALGASSPRPALVAMGPLLRPRPVCGYQGSQRRQPAP